MHDHYYDRKKKDTVVCLAGARSLLWPEKKVLVICLAGARSLLRPEKKVLVVCLAGARSLLRPEKKVLVVCLVGARSLLRPEKKDTVVCLAGARHQLIPPNKMVELKTYELCVKNFLLPTSHPWRKKIPLNQHLLTLIVLVGSFIKLWPEKKGGNLQNGMALSIQ